MRSGVVRAVTCRVRAPASVLGTPTYSNVVLLLTGTSRLTCSVMMQREDVNQNTRRTISRRRD